jgi:hypothetical protein
LMLAMRRPARAQRRGGSMRLWTAGTNWIDSVWTRCSGASAR